MEGALRTEASALLAGLLFSIAVFAFKTAVGEFYWLSGGFRRRTRFVLLAATTFAYLLLWSAAGCLVESASENPVALFYHSKLFQGGAALHLLIAAGFFLWGALLLARRSGEHCRGRGGWLLAVPCPVCAGAILLSAALGKLLLPELGWKLWGALAGCFFLVDFAVLAVLGILSRRSGNAGAGKLTGYLMLFVGLYFAGLLIIVPNFEQVEAMYRAAAGTAAAPARALWVTLPAAALLLAGLFRESAKQRRSGMTERRKNS